ncbi:phage baseplate assembly protein V [Campylobacter jejuni]
MASNHSGFFHTPRIGDEVIISFLDDDIDKPYVSSSLYNGANPSLANLPFNDHQTSLSSKTIGVNEEGYNELTLSNIKDKEQIYLKAQKDYDELVQHNFTQRILNDKDSIVDGIYNERIKKVHTQTIDLAKNVNVGGEYLTNVGLSKDTIVGLSNTLNVGVDNKARVAKNSHEFVGENKDIEIGANQNTIIHKDEIRNVKGNKKEVVEGHYGINVSDKMQVLSEKEMDYKSKDNILFTSNESIGFESDKNTSMVADNITTYAKTIHELKADSEATIQVGETIINAKPDCVIIKAGGVEVIIDSNGLVVKGGELKAE